jgi:hypothetical protein
MRNPKELWMGMPLLLLGCGGQGAGGDTSNRTLNVYAAAESCKNYSHVWVGIERVNVTNGITSDTVFTSSEPGGLKVDLATLHAKQGPQYLFLGIKQFAAGLFSNAEVMVSNTATVEVGKTGEKRTVHFGPESSPSAMWTLDMTKTKPIAPGYNLVVDFDPGHWTETEGVLKAPKKKFVLAGDAGGMMDPSRHVPQTLSGIVQDLTGGDTSRDFTLVTTCGTLEVRARTEKPSPEVAEGGQVKAYGVYDPAASVFNADKLETPQPLAGRLPLPQKNLLRRSRHTKEAVRQVISPNAR